MPAAFARQYPSSAGASAEPSRWPWSRRGHGQGRGPGASETLPPSRRVTNLLAGWPISRACSAEQEQGVRARGVHLGRPRSYRLGSHSRVGERFSSPTPRPVSPSTASSFPPPRFACGTCSSCARTSVVEPSTSMSKGLFAQPLAAEDVPEPQGDRPLATQGLTLCDRDFRNAGNPTISTDREAPCDSFV